MADENSSVSVEASEEQPLDYSAKEETHENLDPLPEKNPADSSENSADQASPADGASANESQKECISPSKIPKDEAITDVGQKDKGMPTAPLGIPSSSRKELSSPELALIKQFSKSFPPTSPIFEPVASCSGLSASGSVSPTACPFDAQAGSASSNELWLHELENFPVVPLIPLEEVLASAEESNAPPPESTQQPSESESLIYRVLTRPWFTLLPLSLITSAVAVRCATSETTLSEMVANWVEYFNNPRGKVVVRAGLVCLLSTDILLFALLFREFNRWLHLHPEKKDEN